MLPELNPIERLWKLLRHRVTHNRLFQTLSELTHALSRTLRALGRRYAPGSIAIYTHYSSDRQRETSIEDQVRRCREHIAQAGGDPAKAIVFSDFAVSGSSLDRPGFERSCKR